MYMQQLALIIVHTPPCEANKVSNAILFCSVIFESCETSYWNPIIVSAVLLPRISTATEMLTKAFSNSLAPNQGRNYLVKERNAVGLLVDYYVWSYEQMFVTTILIPW